jgi:hypothetical protein
MSELSDFLSRTVGYLDEAGIPYMVAGSLTSNAFGHPRTTNDVDIVIDPTIEQAEKLISLIGDNFYADLTSAKEAVERRSMFNIIDFATGYKADLVIRKDRPFSSSEFDRRQRNVIAETDVWAATPEDTILAKLEWARIGDSERQYRDAFNIAAIEQESLDQAYLHKWAVELGVDDLLARLLEEAGLNPTDPGTPP